MKKRQQVFNFFLTCSLLSLNNLSLPIALAQEGHPLVGTWQGNWGEDNSLLTVIINWDGEHFSGIVNPGPGSGEPQNITLDSSKWWVEMSLPVTDANLNSVPFTLKGSLENITSRTRAVNATWHYNSESGSMRLERQSGP